MLKKIRALLAWATAIVGGIGLMAFVILLTLHRPDIVFGYIFVVSIALLIINAMNYFLDL